MMNAIMRNKNLLIFYSLPAAMLVISAAAHRLQMNTAAYTTSWLIYVEFALLVFVGLSCLLLPLYAIGAIWQRAWGQLAATGVAACIALISIFLAFLIDSPTLIYAT